MAKVKSKIIKSAVTGKFINKGYAKGHGSTSITQKVTKKCRCRKKK